MSIERRASAGSVKLHGRTVSGLAARYSIPTKLPGFTETIAPGAFRNVLAGKDLDVALLQDHAPSKLLARTPTTLTLTETHEGLAFTANLADTNDGRDVYELVRRGDLRGCSFAFILESGDQEWTEDRNGPKRTIRNFKTLQDISLVTYPAYQGTSVVARAEDVSVECRSRVESFLASRTFGVYVVDAELRADMHSALRQNDIHRQRDVVQLARRRQMLDAIE